MTSDADDNPLRTYYEREFSELQNLKSHRSLAAAAALYLCKLDAQTPPHWVVEEAAELLCDFLSNKPNPKGRAKSISARYKQDLIDLERWDAVCQMRAAQKRVSDEVQQLKKRGLDVSPGARAGYVRDRMKMSDWLGHTFSRALECAALTLSGRDAFGSPETMLKSYKKIQRHIKQLEPQRQSPSYWPVDERFLQRIGFKSLHERRKGTKILPIYTLA
jgi:hypothetical protein